MFAVVDIAGFQEKVKVGDKLRVPTLDSEPGNKMKFERVLMIVADDGAVTLGAPTVAGASVEVKILEHGRDEKIRVLKMRRRKRFTQVKGHRQGKTEIEVTGISL